MPATDYTAGSGWYDAGSYELPIPTATVDDLKAESEKPEKLMVRPKGWHLKLFNLHDPKDVAEYEKLRMKLHEKLIRKRAMVVRECVQVLNGPDGQRLYQLIEWEEFDFSIQRRKMAEIMGEVKKDGQKSA